MPATKSAKVGSESGSRNTMLLVAAAAVLVLAGVVYYVRREPNPEETYKEQYNKATVNTPAKTEGTTESGSLDIGDSNAPKADTEAAAGTEETAVEGDVPTDPKKLPKPKSAPSFKKD